MSQIFMMTVPRTVHKKVLKIMIAENDCKRWVIGKEVGSNGYEHWQIRLETSNPGFFLWCKTNIPNAHVEKAGDSWTYERKEGEFWCSSDTDSIRSVRFGTLNKQQKHWWRTAINQSDREIDVWFDPSGNHGKSWFSVFMWEHGRACLVPRYAMDSRGLVSFVCSYYRENGWRPLIILDIPRAAAIPAGLYETIEQLKDGVISDPRYSAHDINIRGVKVIVFTNKKLDTKKLSQDRWRLHGIQEDGSLSS